MIEIVSRDATDGRLVGGAVTSMVVAEPGRRVIRRGRLRPEASGGRPETSEQILGERCRTTVFPQTVEAVAEQEQLVRPHVPLDTPGESAATQVAAAHEGLAIEGLGGPEEVSLRVEAQRRIAEHSDGEPTRFRRW